MLSKDFKYYLENQEELVKKYNEKFIVIINQEVVGDYDTISEACNESQKKYVLGTFLIQKCTKGDKDTTITLYNVY